MDGNNGKVLVEAQNTTKLGIKNLAEDDRPREKLRLKGSSALSDSELLAIILGSGNAEESAIDLSKRILADFKNNWNDLARLSIKELCKYKGVGEAKAISILAALEIAHRKSKQEAYQSPTIKSSKEAYALLEPEIAHKSTEHFAVIYLSAACRVIRDEIVFTGGITSTVVDQRIIFKRAIELSATQFILAHNHPSGSLVPSASDRQLTQKMKNSGEILGIQLLDHLIVTPYGYFSFADEGEL